MKPSPLAALVLLAACSPAGESQGESQLIFPVDCVVGQTCEIQNYVDRDPGPEAKDYRCETRTYQDHNGVDIRIPNMSAQRAGVYVLAAAPGVVARMRNGVADVSVRAPDAASVDGVECGNGVVVDHGEGWETQYCHLARRWRRARRSRASACRETLSIRTFISPCAETARWSIPSLRTWRAAGARPVRRCGRRRRWKR